jgi:hypothetical protein
MIKRIDPSNYDTEKNSVIHYLEYYEQFFSPFVNKDIVLLELGVRKGGSLQLWRDYFRKGTIVGVDINDTCIDDDSGRIKFYRGAQQNIELLEMIAEIDAPDGFDIIIDDCSHIGAFTKASFEYLFDTHLKSGGIYAIEDWGTGYWEAFIDGKAYYTNRQYISTLCKYCLSSLAETVLKPILPKRLHQKIHNVRYYKQRFPSHDWGMVGFVKQLIDGCALEDITMPGRGISPSRPSKIKRIHYSRSLVILEKK